MNVVETKDVLGGEPFTVRVLLSYQGLEVSASALVDTGANASLLIDSSWAKQLTKVLGTPTEPLSSPCTLQDFSGSTNHSASRVSRINLTIDGRRFLLEPFVEVPLGQPPIIIGRRWLASNNVELCIAKSSLRWPRERQKDYLSRNIRVRLWTPRVSQKHQQDMERRDSLFEKGVLSPTENKYEDSHMTIASPVSSLSIEELDEISQIRHILPEEYKTHSHVFSKRLSDKLPPSRDCDHVIKLNKTLSDRVAPLYKMSPDKLDALRRYLDDNLKKGFIEKCSAPYTSPVLFVPKADGSLRLCIDYRQLNEITEKDRMPLPLIDETLARLGEASCFTKLDIRQAFHRIRMSENSRNLTAFRTRYGTYRYNVLPFGLCNGPATFQRLLNEVLWDFVDEFCCVYLDDIIVFSKGDRANHAKKVTKILTALGHANLQVDIKKSEFFVDRVKYLGFIVTTRGIETDPEKTVAVREWATPTTAKQVRGFLGFCNFYRRFIQNYSSIASPLLQLTRKDVSWKWRNEEESSFQTLKDKLTSAPILVHYNPRAQTQLETDASDGIVAGVLSQQTCQGWQPVGFFSKVMTEAEMRYDIHDRELLAVVRSLGNWEAELQGLQTSFTIITDHRALEYFSKKRKLNGRQIRWQQEFTKYNCKLVYRPGKDNAAADSLSRKSEVLTTQRERKEADYTSVLLPKTNLQTIEKPPAIKSTSPSTNIVGAQEKDNENQWSHVNDQATTHDNPDNVLLLIDKILKANRDPILSAHIRDKPSDGDCKIEIKNGLVLRNGKLYVPDIDCLRTLLIQEIHSSITTGHPGKMKTKQLVMEQYYWPRMGADIDRYVANCVDCRKAKRPRDPAPGLLQPLPIPQRPWQHISTDFKDMPRDKEGYSKVVVFVDRFGKRAFTLPCAANIDARETARLYYVHVWRIYGMPESVTSDRGPQFVSAYLDELYKLTGVKKKLSSAFHPQTDGNTEILNQYIDQRLRPFVNHYQDNWSELLPALDFAQATLPHYSTGLSPFELEFGYRPRRHWDWSARTRKDCEPRELMNRKDAANFARRAFAAQEWAKKNLIVAQQRQKNAADRHRREIDFGVGDKVMLSTKGLRCGRPSKKLGHQNIGPFRIKEKIGHSFALELPKDMRVHNLFHADRLRKFPGNPLPGQSTDAPEPTIYHSEEEFEVSEITNSRISRGQLQYQANWKGYDTDRTWYPATNFKGAPTVLKTFHDRYPAAAGPPKNLAKWNSAYESGIELDDEESDNSPEHK